MGLIKRLGRRSRVSDVVYRLLNIVYAASLFLLVSPGVGLPYLAYLLVVLSKWRVFAVRPRFWFANLQANFIDFMVGISVVTLMILASATVPWAGAMLAVLFAVWLLVLKPHTAQRWMLVQAAVGQFIALMALFSLAHDFEFDPVITDSSVLTVVLAWLIGYMTARHALSAFRSEDDRTLLSLIWGFVVAEIAWLAHHWTIAYPLLSKDLMIPHVAIFITLLSVAAIAWYRVLHVESDKKAFTDARSVTIFVVVVNVILLVWRYGLGDIASL
ncbi:MAG TPA: hypothetical protein VF597_04545 [Candidatus Saccharimonadales bacterium]|jgi:hypothetical protein